MMMKKKKKKIRDLNLRASFLGFGKERERDFGNGGKLSDVRMS